MDLSSWLQRDGERLRLAILLQPKGSRGAIIGVHDNMLKVVVTAPPVEGKANKALVQLLAKTFGLAKRDVQLIGGQTSRRKAIALSGITEQEVRRRVAALLNGAQARP